MAEARTLFGRKVVPHHMLNYAEQVYDILVGEIELGRWEVNERLPGVIALAGELGFGTKTIQTAYDRLKRDGYVQTRGYRGTFLKTQHPIAKVTAGKVGVLVSPEQSGQPLILWYQHVIFQLARRKGLVVEVRTVPEEVEGGRAAQRGVIFGEDVSGVISLTPFRMPVRFGDAKDTLPVVFLCPPYERCVPKVCADVREAYYDLTARLIRYGHTRVVFSEDAVEPDPRQTEMHREGYLEAMAEHGLPVNQEILDASRSVRNTDLHSVAGHLAAIVRIRRARRPTAVVAGSLGRSTVLTRVAPLQNVRIPQDLSVVSIGSAHIAGGSGPQLTGMLPDFDQMVNLCLTLLEQQTKTGKCDFTKVHVRMHFVPGHTLRRLSRGAGERAEGFEAAHDLRSLSEFVES